MNTEELEKPYGGFEKREDRKAEVRPWWHPYNRDKDEFRQAMHRFFDPWFNELRCNRGYHARDIYNAASDILNGIGSTHRSLESREPQAPIGVMTNTEVLFFVLGKQGGTIHQLAKTLDVETDDILYANHERMGELCRLAQNKRLNNKLT